MKILVKDHYNQHALAMLESKTGTCVTQSHELQMNEKELEETDILLIRSRTKLNQAVLSRARRLKLVVTATSGFDHIDLAYCKQHQIKVAHTPEANRDSAAELTIMLILNCSRHSYIALKTIEVNGWRQDVPRGHSLVGKKLGIIGLGRVGSRVAELAQGFKMSIAAYDPYKDDAYFKAFQADRLDYPQILKQSDIVTYHVPLTDETRHMVDRQALAHCKDGAVVINACRGEVVDENDLYQALKNQKIAAAGLDVFEAEPLPQESKLRKLPNVFMTPHMGAYTYESISEASHMAVQGVLSFLENRELPCCLV